MSKKNANKPVLSAIWLAVWEEAEVGEGIQRLQSFTVAQTKEEAIKIMEIGLLGYDDILYAGRLKIIKRVPVGKFQTAKVIEDMRKIGARFVLPADRVSDSLLALLTWFLLLEGGRNAG